MKCNQCYAKIELVHERDRVTRMHSNYWWCGECNKRVEPSQPGMLVSMGQIQPQAVIDEIRRQWNAAISGQKTWRTPIIGSEDE